MSSFAELAVLLGIVPVTLALFTRLPPRRAVLAAFLLGTLFLPVRGRDIPGPIDLEKEIVTGLAVLLAVLAFDGRRLFSVRPGLVDLPAATLCLSPIATSLLNGLGLWDGISVAIVHAFTWGVPWWMGRVYLRDREALRDAAVALLIGGIVYALLALFEIRFSPQLHRWLYGYHPRPFMMVKRYGGFRPMLFMDSSLMVGMWMAVTTVVAWWLWRSGTLRRLRLPIVRGVSMGWVVLLLVVTTLLCKTTGAITLMILGILLFEATRATRSRVPLVALALMAGLYGPIRTADLLHTETVLSVASRIYSEERVNSLYIRLINEDAVTEKAMQRPWFGWGGYGRARAKPVEGRSIVDGLWMIVLGKYGLVGLGAVTLMYLMPALRMVGAGPRRGLTTPRLAAATALATVAVLYWIDSLSNGFVNEALLVALGGAAGARLRAPRAPEAVEEAPAQAAPAPEPEPASLGRGLRSGPSGSPGGGT